ncbi:methyltransferase [Mycolicibacterium helvum]|uniref:Methyltransferase n=2 Tax=Mycolicibacterium helvum TaxID=1534349 RepID=A0A7I7T1D3_9MYCO|nr:methyltransferase [Mycolicibacterium helvum]
MYAERAARMVPAYRDIHRLASVLIGEYAQSDARILVLGAGGGLETKSFAEAQLGWTFDAVDPSAAMLDLATQNLGAHASRVRMHHGYIDDAPPGPFAGATSLLTLHFLTYDQRCRTAAQVRQRLAPGAPFVVAHLSFPQRDDDERELWLRRHVANLVASGIDPAVVDKARVAIATEVPVLSPEQDRAVLLEAGFTGVTEFFSAFTFRGWVGYA